MVKNLVIIKLGGSVITDKNINKPIFKKRVVKRLCREIYAAKKREKFNLILVHGAGSFGHYTAKKFKLNKGYLGPESSIGVTLTKKEVLELNLLLITELINVGINVSLVETSAVAKTNGGIIEKFDTSIIKDLLTKNITPVLSGDVVFDSKMGIAILSGDQIATYLAKKLGADKVVFVSNVDGIFDKNPNIHKNAKLIPEINKTNYKKVINQMKIHNKSDVTGEMKGKIQAIRKDLSGAKVLIINGLKEGNMLKSLISPNGHKIGTVLEF